MEAFGRVAAVLLAVTGLTFCLIFMRKAPAVRQKYETVYSLVTEYAEKILKERRIIATELGQLKTELAMFGEYEAEITVYERRRYEKETGRVYLYAVWEGEEQEKELNPGAYVCLKVVQKGRGKLETLLYGEGNVIVAGGRVP